MEDFLSTIVFLAKSDPAPIDYMVLILIIGAIGILGPVLVDIVFSFKKDKCGITPEEEHLISQHNILFRAMVELKREGKSVDFEQRMLLEIGENLDAIRAKSNRR